MNQALIVCGKVFTPELVNHLNLVLAENPKLSQNALARLVCEPLGWRSPNGRAATSSAKVALRKRQPRGLLPGPGSSRPGTKRTHRLRPSGHSLPKVARVPAHLSQVQGLHLYLLSGHEDPLHGLWNDLMIQQHPCGQAPLVGPQLRYLIGSEHGWLGALGFGPASFVLGARDQWIGWSRAARLSHLNQVVGLARFVLRREVHCRPLASKVLSLARHRLAQDWPQRYGVEPLLVETFVDRSRFTGRCFAAANWRRIGTSTGGGRLGAKTPAISLKDIWVYPLRAQARSRLQPESPPPVTPRPLVQSLAQAQWWAGELATLDLGDERLHRRAQAILQARWTQPQASFYGRFESWTPAKGAYSFIGHQRAPISLQNLLAPHSQATLARMAAEPLVLLPEDTTTLNFSGLHQTTGLGPLGQDKGRGLWLHSLLAYRSDGVPLGVVPAQCWARAQKPEQERGRNARSIDEKESRRWLEALRTAGAAARRMPQTQVVVITDREGDLYELHEAVQLAAPNLHPLIGAQHDRNLEGHEKLWAFMAAQPVGDTRAIQVPRRRGQSARPATVQLRWSPITIEAPQVGCKKGWPSLKLWAVWVHEPHPPKGVEPIDWMLLSDLPVTNAQAAWEKVQWYRCRWGIEEWPRVLKTGCNAEGREFKTAEHLQRALAVDRIVAWRVLACLKLGRALPQLPAKVLYTAQELAVLWAAVKKSPAPAAEVDLRRGQPTGGAAGRLCGPNQRRATGGGEYGDWVASADGLGAGLATAPGAR